MACFYAFLVLALLPLVYPASMAVVQFISSGVLQLIALPLLAVAAKIIQEQQDQHKRDVSALHAKQDAAAEMHVQHAADLAALHGKHDELHEAVRRKISPRSHERKSP